MKLRNILALMGLLALGLVIYLNRDEFVRVWHLLQKLRWYVLVIIILLQLASYWVNGLYYRSILRIFGYEVGTERLYEGALATNFVNYVLPTAGLAGAGYLSQVLSPEVPRGESFLTQLMRYALSGLAVLFMLPVGIALLLASKESANPVVKATIISAAAITLLAVLTAALVQREKWVYHILNWIARDLKRVFKKFDVERVRGFADEFYAGWHRLTAEKRKMAVPFGWSIVYIAIEMGTFYVTFLAFSIVMNPGITVMAYLFANIASIFGGVFISTGVFEVGMAGTLVALGTPFALAFSVTVVYRALNLLVGLPAGFYFYRKYLP